jgi:hypothetical protein
MARRSLDQLPMSPMRYRLDKRTKRSDGVIRFETQTASQSEDGKRGEWIPLHAPTLPRRKLRRRAERLAKRLSRSGAGEKVPQTLSSSCYMRELRLRIGGWMWALVDRPECDNARTFTLIPRGGSIPVAGLWAFNPVKFIEGIRADINRKLGKERDGFLILFLDAEFDTESEVYSFHVHGLAAGALLEAVRKLKPGKHQRKGKRPSNKYRSDEQVHKRVMVGKKPLNNLPDPLTYMCKPFWTRKRTGIVCSGKVKRENRKGRIREPFHTQLLVWLDRYSISDISLMMRMRVTDKGFMVG